MTSNGTSPRCINSSNANSCCRKKELRREFESQGGDPGDDLEITLRAAVIALEPPERDENARLHAVALVHFVQQRLVRVEVPLPIGDTFRRDAGIDVLPERLGQFRLPSIEFEDAIEVSCARKRLADRVTGQPLVSRLRLDVFQPDFEALRLRLRRLACDQKGGKDRARAGATEHCLESPPDHRHGPPTLQDHAFFCHREKS